MTMKSGGTTSTGNCLTSMLESLPRLDSVVEQKSLGALQYDEYESINMNFPNKFAF